MCTKYRPEKFSAFFYVFQIFTSKKFFFCPSTQSNLAHLKDIFTINIAFRERSHSFIRNCKIIILQTRKYKEFINAILCYKFTKYVVKLFQISRKCFVQFHYHQRFQYNQNCCMRHHDTSCTHQRILNHV